MADTTLVTITGSPLALWGIRRRSNMAKQASRTPASNCP